jgi:hypothetical protein
MKAARAVKYRIRSTLNTDFQLHLDLDRHRVEYVYKFCRSVCYRLCNILPLIGHNIVMLGVLSGEEYTLCPCLNFYMI